MLGSGMRRLGGERFRDFIEGLRWLGDGRERSRVAVPHPFTKARKDGPPGFWGFLRDLWKPGSENPDPGHPELW